MARWEDFENIIGIKFKNKKLLKQAFTHSSKAAEKGDLLLSNERLEFLGDSVLNLTVTEFIFLNYPDFLEGTLAKFRAEIVSTQNLAKLGRRLNLGKYIDIPATTEADNIIDRDSVLADTAEAVIGAVYLDQGIDACKEMILKNIKETIGDLQDKIGKSDYKTRLQEITMKIDKTTPLYKLIAETGPAHQRTFVIQVTALSEKTKGTGRSKKEAEQEAAKLLIDKIEK